MSGLFPDVCKLLDRTHALGYGGVGITRPAEGAESSGQEGRQLGPSISHAAAVLASDKAAAEEELANDRLVVEADLARQRLLLDEERRQLQHDRELFEKTRDAASSIADELDAKLDAKLAELCTKLDVKLDALDSKLGALSTKLVAATGPDGPLARRIETRAPATAVLELGAQLASLKSIVREGTRAAGEASQAVHAQAADVGVIAKFVGGGAGLSEMVADRATPVVARLDECFWGILTRVEQGEGSVAEAVDGSLDRLVGEVGAAETAVRSAVYGSFDRLVGEVGAAETAVHSAVDGSLDRLVGEVRAAEAAVHSAVDTSVRAGLSDVALATRLIKRCIGEHADAASAAVARSHGVLVGQAESDVSLATRLVKRCIGEHADAASAAVGRSHGLLAGQVESCAAELQHKLAASVASAIDGPAGMAARLREAVDGCADEAQARLTTKTGEMARAVQGALDEATTRLSSDAPFDAVRAGLEQHSRDLAETANAACSDLQGLLGNITVSGSAVATELGRVQTTLVGDVWTAGEHIATQVAEQHASVASEVDKSTGGILDRVRDGRLQVGLGLERTKTELLDSVESSRGALVRGLVGDLDAAGTEFRGCLDGGKKTLAADVGAWARTVGDDVLAGLESVRAAADEGMAGVATAAERAAGERIEEATRLAIDMLSGMSAAITAQFQTTQQAMVGMIREAEDAARSAAAEPEPAQSTLASRKRPRLDREEEEEDEAEAEETEFSSCVERIARELRRCRVRDGELPSIWITHILIDATMFSPQADRFEEFLASGTPGRWYCFTGIVKRGVMDSGVSAGRCFCGDRDLYPDCAEVKRVGDGPSRGQIEFRMAKATGS